MQGFSWELKAHYQSGQFAQDSGMKLFYVKKGSGDKVVFLPGLLTTSYSFRKVIEILSNHYQAISLDWPGSGFSEPPIHPYSHRYLAIVLKEFLEEIFGDEKVHLVCHEFSGPIAFLMLNDYPEKVKSLTIVTSFLNLKKASFSLPVALLRIPIIGYFISYLYIPLVFQLLNNLFVFSKENPMSLELARDYYYQLFHGDRKKNIVKLCKNIDRTIHAQRDMESGIRKMVGPRQIILGAQDPTENSNQTEYMMQVTRLSGVQVINSGHIPMEDLPLQFSDKIVPLIESLNRNKNKKPTITQKWKSTESI